MRGFAVSEYETRLARAQSMMAAQDLAALLLTTEAEIRYFTGFLTRFWESPSRPWFLVVPAAGKPVAVIPRIGAALMAQTWVSDIRTWSSPDPVDDGVTLLSDTLNEAAPHGRIGIPAGPETYLRIPQADWERVKASVTGPLPECPKSRRSKGRCRRFSAISNGCCWKRGPIGYLIWPAGRAPMDTAM